MNISILFGASSYEHEISIVSAITMKKVLTKSQLIFIFIDKYREIYLIQSSDLNSKLFSSGQYKKSKRLILKQGGFFINRILGDKRVSIDVTLNLVHGRDGEDGKIASLMEFYNIPFISPRVEASTISYNKLYTKIFAQNMGISVVEYQHLSKLDERVLKLSYPVIIKPVRLGSSIGVSIVKEDSELDYALDIAFEFDNDVIIEPFIDGVKEYNQAGVKSDKWEFSIIEEPQKEEFLDFEKKYMDFARDSTVTSASLSKNMEDKIQNTFKKIYDPLFLGSIIRCDFFIVGDEVLLNEINPIPGSMANYLFKDFEDILNRLNKNLPKERTIVIDYQYIHSIQSAKGKSNL
ncbi:MAG: D-alanine--D-alanine ligase [Sulfurovum sp.]|nr:D-alanine--D-alanine ligase [Sulfurovaceae bacterium]